MVLPVYFFDKEASTDLIIATQKPARLRSRSIAAIPPVLFVLLTRVWWRSFYFSPLKLCLDNQ